MPFGLCHAPAIFQATMNDLLWAHLFKFVILFFDYILIYSSTWAGHLTNLEQVFKLLLKGQFYLKSEKCCFALQQVEYLGHIVKAGTVSPDPSRIQAMLD